MVAPIRLFEAPKIPANQAIKLKETIIHFFSNFPDTQNPFFGEYQKTIESFFHTLFFFKEEKFDDSIDHAGQFIDYSFQCILDLTGLKAYPYKSLEVGNSDRYYALKNSFLGKSAPIYKILSLSRCIYILRNRVQHNSTKVGKYNKFLLFLIIYEFLLLVKLDEIYSNNKNSEIVKDQKAIQDFVFSTNAITNITGIFQRSYIFKFLKILHLNKEEIDNRFNSLTIPSADLKEMEKMLDYVLEILAEPNVSNFVFDRNILPFDVIRIYSGARAIFPYEEISPFLIQNLKSIMEEPPKESFKFGGPSIDDLNHHSYVHIPHICNSILVSLGENKRVKISGNSGLGKSTLAKIICYFYSKNIKKIDFSNIYNNITTEFPNPAYYFDFFSQEHNKIEKALRTLKQLTVSLSSKYDFNKILLIIDNAQLIVAKEMNLVDFLSDYLKIMLIIKTEENVSDKKIENDNQDQIQEKRKRFEEDKYDLNENEEYLEEIITQILHNANPNIDPRTFIDPLSRVPDFSSMSKGGFEKNLWTVAFLARILHKAYLNNETSLSCHQILTDFQRFNTEVREFIQVRFEQFLTHMRENQFPIVPSEEKKVRDHLELVIIVIALMSQFEIPLEKELLKLLSNVDDSRFSLFSSRLKHIDFNYDKAIKIVEFLTLKGELIQKEGFNKELEFFLPHQKLSIILKNSLLYPLNPQEISDFQAEFFTFYLEHGKYFGNLMKFLENFTTRETSQKVNLSRLYPENNSIAMQQNEQRFYLLKLLKSINPPTFENQLANGFLDQIIEGLIVLANLSDSELKGFHWYATTQIAIPDTYKNTIRDFFNSIYPDGTFFEKIFVGLFKRSLKSQKNTIDFEGFDHLHYLWFYYTKHPAEEWTSFLKNNTSQVISLIRDSDLTFFFMHTKSDFAQSTQNKQSPQRNFYLSLFATYGKKIVKAFSDLEFIDNALLVNLIQLSGYEEVFTKIIEQHFKTQLVLTPLSRTFEVLDEFSEDIRKDPKLHNTQYYVFPSFNELNQIVLNKLKNVNLTDLVLFFDISLNVGEKDSQIQQLFDKIFNSNIDSIRDSIKTHTAMQIFQTFYRELALNFNDIIKTRGPFLQNLFGDMAWLVEKVNSEEYDDLENIRTFCILLEHFNSILHFQSDADVQNIFSKLTRNLLNTYEHFTSFEEIEKLLLWHNNLPLSTLHYKRLFAQIFFQMHLTNIIPLFLHMRTISLSRFFQLLEASLDITGLPNPKKLDSEIFSIWTCNEQKDQFLHDILIPFTIQEIKLGRFDCIEFLSSSSILSEFLLQLQKAIEEDPQYAVLDFAFDMSKEGLSQKEFRVDKTVPYIILDIKNANFELYLLRFLKHFKKIDHTHPYPKIAPMYQDYLTSLQKKVHQLIENWHNHFKSSGTVLNLGNPWSLIEFLILLFKYHKTIGISLLENNPDILSSFRENTEIFITYGWYLRALLQSITPPISNPSIQSRLNEIWDEKMATLNAVQFELFCVVAHIAFLRGFYDTDYSLEGKNQYFQNVVFDNNKDIEAALTSIKIYEGGLTFEKDFPPSEWKKHIKIALKQNYLLLPVFSLPPIISPEVFSNYHTSFRHYLSKNIINLLSSRLRFFYGPANLEGYFQREMNRLNLYLQNYLSSRRPQETIPEIGCPDLPTFHSYLCFLKLALTYKINNLYPIKADPETLPNSYNQLLYRGQIPLLLENIWKSQNQLQGSKPVHNKIKNELEIIIQPLENFIQVNLHDEDLVAGLFSGMLRFNDLVLFASDFPGFYQKILKIILTAFETFFEETPSVFDHFEDQDPYALFSYLSFLYHYLCHDDPEQFLPTFSKYKHKLADLMLAAGPPSIQGLLFLRFPLEFVQFLLNELDSTIIFLLEQDYPFWNLGQFFGRGESSVNYFLDRYESELRDVCEKPRMDSLTL